MGPSLRIILPLLFFLLQGSRPFASGCLECHVVHYPEQGTCIDCHQGRGDTVRKEIAHHRFLAARFAAFTLAKSPVVEQGNRLLEKGACRRCHQQGGEGNRLAANLDWRSHAATPDEIAIAIWQPALYMPDFRFSEKQIVALVNAIFASGQKLSPPEQEVPQLIHFSVDEKERQSVFEKKCGGCHRMLTGQRGGVGRGTLGPNLSGILSRFYPRILPEGKEWTEKLLEDWVKNPRELRKYAQMAPVHLKDEEWTTLEEELVAAK